MSRSPIWWKGDEAITLDRSPTNASSYTGTPIRDEFSFQSSFQASPYNNYDQPIAYDDRRQGVFVVPVRGSETPLTCSKLPQMAGSSTPELELKLANAPAENVQGVALEMFRALKRNGLVDQANRAVKQLGDSFPSSDTSLLGMDFILKDGVVKYLREVSKLTPPVPKQVVRFCDVRLNVVQEQSLRYETFGRKFLGCFIGPFVNLLGRKSISRKIEVLKNLDGYIMPGSTTLLLGPPGSGKSSLLKVLAGRCQPDKKTKLQGTVMYNDKLASEVLLSRLIAYINGQVNRHLPFLTVRETLEFAADCTQGMIRPKNFTPKMKRYFAQALVQGQDPYLEYVLHVLGLKPVENHLVGSGKDGLSETDKHRLTSAEIAMGTYAVMLYDQPCYEQDSEATYELVFTLRAISRIQQSSAVMSLVQVSPEVFQLFDRVIVLGDGHILYQGPRQDVLDYFSRLGFIKPSHVDTAAFLQDIGAGDGGQYVSGNCKLYTVEELAEIFRASELYKDIMRIVNSDHVGYTYWVESEPNIGLSIRQRTSQNTELVVTRAPTLSQGIESTGALQGGDVVTGISNRYGNMEYIAVGPESEQRRRANELAILLGNARGHVRLQVERRASTETEADEPDSDYFRKEYVQSWWESTKTVTKRQLKLAGRLRVLILLRLMQVIILGVFGGSIFYHFGGSLDQGDMNIVRAIGFVSTFSILLVNVVQLPIHMIQRPVFYKHRAQRFFRVSSYLAAQSIVNAPQSFVEALLYSVPVYFLARLSLERAGLHFVQFLFLLSLVAYMGSFLVIFLSTIAPVLEAGNALAGLLVSLGLLFSGFVIFPSLTPSYWKWMLTANPLRWGNIVFCLAEFSRFHQPCTDFQNLPFCNAHPDLSVARAYLIFFQLESENHWLLISYVAIAGSALVLALASYVGLSKVVFSEISPSLPSDGDSYQQLEEDEKDENSISWDGLSRITEMSNLEGKTVWEKDTYDEERGYQAGGGGQVWRTSHIPVKPLALSFHQVSLLVREQKTGEEKLVLDRVSGHATPGTMLAITGSMKSGKSSLLRLLAGRVDEDLLTGDVLVNGYRLDRSTFSRLSGFVEEVDAHQPFLTVKESLEFSAGLRFGESTTAGRRAFHVELVLELMGLVFVKDFLVGSLKFANGKTFELAKKLTIAVELAANPSMIFLEDPTSDLDSVATRSILFAIQTVAASGRTLVCTIQQPSVRVLSAFNHVLILRPGGEQVYFGPVGWNCSQLLEYFTTISKAPPYEPSKQSPMTYIFDMIKKNQRNHLVLTYKASRLGTECSEDLKKLRKQYRRNSLKPVASPYAASFTKQSCLVFLRTQRFLWRNVQYTFGRLSGSIALGLLLGSVYFQISSEDTFSVTSRSLFIYIQVMLLGVIIANNVVPQLGTDRLVYYRERRSGMYAPILYPISWAIAEIPYLFIATLFFVAIANGMAGIATDTLANFLAYWLCLFIFTATVMFFGMFITIATPLPVLAAFVVSITSSIWVAASGVIVPKSKMRFYQWLYWANPFQYVTHGLTAISFFCDTKTEACATCRVGSACPGCACKRLLNLEDSVPGSLPVFVWDRLSSQRSLEIQKVLVDFGALGGMSFLFALLAFVSFVWLKHNRG